MQHLIRQYRSSMKWFVHCLILILVILIGITIFTFSENERIMRAPYQSEISEIEVSIVPDKLIYNRHDTMTLTIYNQSTVDFLTGHALNYEIKIDGQWYTIETDYFYFLNYVGLLAGKSVTEKVDLSVLDYTFLRETDYRVTKIIDGKHVVSPTFRIE